MSRSIKIIGVNYPQVGDVIYWKDSDGEIHDDVCLKIEHKDDPSIATMYYISIESNRNCTFSSFITEDNIINPLSADIDIYKEKRAQEKIKEISKYIAQEEVKNIIINKLSKFYSDEQVDQILDILTDY